MKKPRILIINPNSSAEMTEAIQKNALAFAGEDMEVLTVLTPGTSPFIATYEDHALAAPGMMELLRKNEKDWDAFVIGCNVSDIFPDVTVSITSGGETVDFSPYISLKDGSVQVGARGLNITRISTAP